MQTKAALDYETKSSYSMTVTATDPSGASDTITVTITVTNADDEGKVTLSSTQPQVGTPLTATLTDPDGDVTDLTWQWEVSDDAADGPFTLINGATSATFTPGTRDVEKHLKAKASYTVGEDSDNSATAESANPVRAAGEPPSDSIAPGVLRKYCYPQRCREHGGGYQHRRPGHGHGHRQRRHADLLPEWKRCRLLRHYRVVRPVANQNRPGL